MIGSHLVLQSVLEKGITPYLRNVWAIGEVLIPKRCPLRESTLIERGRRPAAYAQAVGQRVRAGFEFSCSALEALGGREARIMATQEAHKENSTASTASDTQVQALLMRESQHSDVPFLREMLYEAVFWRASPDKPSFEEGLAYPEVSKSLADWGERDGDTAVVATVDSIPVGASWFRFWTDGNFISGYIDESTPVLVIAVHRDYRRRGIGGRMIDWLIDYASKHAIPRISLSVSKDNHAIHLYRQQGFLEHADRGDAFTMVRRIHTVQVVP